jgi:hypothetical protein
MPERPDRQRPRAVIERDAALARIGRTRRWVMAGTAALTAGAAGLVAGITPGRSFGAKPAATTHAASVNPAARAATASAPRMPPLADPSSLGLTGPAQPPTAASSNPSQSSPAPAETTTSQSAPAPSQAAPSPSTPAPSQAAPAPAPAPASPPVVSGGS